MRKVEAMDGSARSEKSPAPTTLLPQSPTCRTSREVLPFRMPSSSVYDVFEQTWMSSMVMLGKRETPDHVPFAIRPDCAPLDVEIFLWGDYPVERDSGYFFLTSEPVELVNGLYGRHIVAQNFCLDWVGALAWKRCSELRPPTFFTASERLLCPGSLESATGAPGT
ncbi:hypothetical protein B0H10DRAFT_1943952 [Mycena sp. CBHHK59/15]|nr:hypothetical protein B0H10DRAFT_1943952 [Mycena sp. CBHHK59/15]